MEAEDLYEEMYARRGSWHLVNKEDVIGIMESYHQSKLQALKEYTNHRIKFYSDSLSAIKVGRTPEKERLKGRIDELEKVLDFINNLEDNG